jgi:hypothetical protein
MMAENLQAWARKEIDAICRKFFWARSDQSVQGKCMVTWPSVGLYKVNAWSPGRQFAGQLNWEGWGSVT